MYPLCGITGVCIDLPALCGQAFQEACQVGLMGVD
jgi:hypothetical protein